jgi:hypothetical protein
VVQQFGEDVLENKRDSRNSGAAESEKWNKRAAILLSFRKHIPLARFALHELQGRTPREAIP